MGSSLIIVGSVEPASTEGSDAVVNMSEALKGSGRLALPIRFARAGTRPVMEFRIVPGQMAIVFLTQRDGEFWLLQTPKALFPIASIQDPHVTLFRLYVSLETRPASDRTRWLAATLNSTTWQERWAALKILDDLSLHRAIQIRVLEALLEDPRREVRLVALSAAGNGLSTAAVPHLQRLTLSTESLDVRVAALQALGRIADSRALPSLIAGLKDGTESIREQSARSLMYFKSAPTEPLIIATRDESAAVRRAAIGSLENHRERPVIGTLIERLSDTDEGVRQVAFRLLRQITGQTFDYNPFDPLHLGVPVKRWVEWWSTRQ